MRPSFFTLISISAFCMNCGGDSDDNNNSNNGSTTSPTTSSNTSSPTTNTTNTANTTSASASTTASNTSGSGGSTSAGGSGGTTSAGGSSGDSSGGSAGETTGGTGGGGAGGMGVVVVADCSYEACGGDLANTEWSYARVCVEEDALLELFAACPSIELVSSSGAVSGTIGFDDDTYDQDVDFSVTAEFAVPPACNLVGCELLSSVLTNAGLSEASCTAAGEGCTCTGTLESTSTAAASAYSTDGNDLTLDTVEATYCATGDSFKYTGEIQGVPFVYETIAQ